MLRGGEEEYNNQQWLMGGGGKRRGEVILMIMTSKMAKAMMMTMCMTKGSAKEEDTSIIRWRQLSYHHIPLSSSSLRALPPAPTVMVALEVPWEVAWAVAVAVEDNNNC
jgi:hypothetical protein